MKRRFSDEQITGMINDSEAAALAAQEGSVRSSYGNIVTWRHNFVHEGVWPNAATYGDLKGAYDHGKELIRCMDRAMRRQPKGISALRTIVFVAI
ncbi:HEPN domain-containing protein [Yoonia sp. SS1-5]|uniref:HEPN domain-containing protein n=1 Tax=Yoonia rhodophyticola TaxID=3137370 RepID=A0AAN0MH37_9RHOB